MKNILTFLMLSISIEALGQTNLFVLGSIHTPTVFVNSDYIFNVLNMLQPELILLEADTTLYTLIKTGLDENEINAVRKYLKQKPNTILKAVDYIGRQDFYKSNKSFELKDSINNNLEKLIGLNRLDSNCLQTLQAYSEIGDIFAVLTKQPLRIVNSNLSYLIAEKYQTFTYDKFQEIIDRTPDLKNYSEFYKRESKFWYDRNKAIANNSIKFIKQYKPKIAIIITGFLHKPFVLKELIEQKKEYNFTIKEYWE